MPSPTGIPPYGPSAHPSSDPMEEIDLTKPRSGVQESVDTPSTTSPREEIYRVKYGILSFDFAGQKAEFYKAIDSMIENGKKKLNGLKTVLINLKSFQGSTINLENAKSLGLSEEDWNELKSNLGKNDVIDINTLKTALKQQIKGLEISTQKPYFTQLLKFAADEASKEIKNAKDYASTKLSSASRHVGDRLKAFSHLTGEKYNQADQHLLNHSPFEGLFNKMVEWSIAQQKVRTQDSLKAKAKFADDLKNNNEGWDRPNIGNRLGDHVLTHWQNLKTPNVASSIFLKTQSSILTKAKSLDEKLKSAHARLSRSSILKAAGTLIGITRPIARLAATVISIAIPTLITVAMTSAYFLAYMPMKISLLSATSLALALSGPLYQLGASFLTFFKPTELERDVKKVKNDTQNLTLKVSESFKILKAIRLQRKQDIANLKKIIKHQLELGNIKLPKIEKNIKEIKSNLQQSLSQLYSEMKTNQEYQEIENQSLISKQTSEIEKLKQTIASLENVLEALQVEQDASEKTLSPLKVFSSLLDMNG